MTHALFCSVARAPSSTVLLVTTCQRSFSVPGLSSPSPPAVAGGLASPAPPAVAGGLASPILNRRVENNGFEPLTPCLQSRCSSQLS